MKRRYLLTPDALVEERCDADVLADSLALVDTLCEADVLADSDALVDALAMLMLTCGFARTGWGTL